MEELCDLITYWNFDIAGQYADIIGLKPPPRARTSFHMASMH